MTPQGDSGLRRSTQIPIHHMRSIGAWYLDSNVCVVAEASRLPTYSITSIHLGRIRISSRIVQVPQVAWVTRKHYRRERLDWLISTSSSMGLCPLQPISPRATCFGSSVPAAGARVAEGDELAAEVRGDATQPKWAGGVSLRDRTNRVATSNLGCKVKGLVI